MIRYVLQTTLEDALEEVDKETEFRYESILGGKPKIYLEEIRELGNKRIIEAD